RPRGSDASLLSKAQVWSYHALFADASGRRLARLGWTLFGGTDWRDIERLPMPLVEDILAAVRNPQIETLRRCDGVWRLAEVFGTTREWPQIENVMLQHQFCWPLLVLPDVDSTQTEGEGVGHALPVAVDVFFDGGDRTAVKLGQSLELREHWACVDDHTHIDKGRTSEKSRICHLDHAARVAKALWTATHSSYKSARRRVQSATISYDFSWASAVAQHLAVKLGMPIGLWDGSAGAYFSQVVLGRLLGRSPAVTSAVTGLIGGNLPGQIDYGFVAPKGILRKVRYVF